MLVLRCKSARDVSRPLTARAVTAVHQQSCRQRSDEKSARSQRASSTGNPDSHRLDNSDEQRGPRLRTATKDKLTQRDFFLDVLNASVTKRDAEQYLSRFEPPTEHKIKQPASQREDRRRLDQERLNRTGVNLGSLYASPRAIADSPTFRQQAGQQDDLLQQREHVLHVALVSIRAPQLMDSDALNGVALTLAQLVRLDMQIVVTFDCSGLFSHTQEVSNQQVYQQQARRLVTAIEKYNNAGARYVDSALALSPDHEATSAARLNPFVSLILPKLVIDPLKRTVIPVIPALAYTETFRSVPVDMADVMLAMTRALAGVESETITEGHSTDSDIPTPSASPTTLDRIILVDPLGGLPSSVREDQSHVFVNLEQEHDEICLLYTSPSPRDRTRSRMPSSA